MLHYHSLSRCGSKQGEEDYRPLFENFVQDLLSTVNKPEWPAAELLLSLLGRLLVRLAGPELSLYYWTRSPAGVFQLSTLCNCGRPIGLDEVPSFVLCCDSLKANTSVFGKRIIQSKKQTINPTSAGVFASVLN